MYSAKNPRFNYLRIGTIQILNICFVINCVVVGFIKSHKVLIIANSSGVTWAGSVLCNPWF